MKYLNGVPMRTYSQMLHRPSSEKSGEDITKGAFSLLNLEVISMHQCSVTYATGSMPWDSSAHPWEEIIFPSINMPTRKTYKYQWTEERWIDLFLLWETTRCCENYNIQLRLNSRQIKDIILEFIEVSKRCMDVGAENIVIRNSDRVIPASRSFF